MLDRFLDAQRGDYAAALAEVRRGRKTSHWMWYIFPQIAGLGQSSTARYYSIRDLEEAREYYAHPVLGQRLREISGALLALRGSDPVAVFGGIDSMKLKSSMTLFAVAAPDDPIFQQVLDMIAMIEDNRLQAHFFANKTAELIRRNFTQSFKALHVRLTFLAL